MSHLLYDLEDYLEERAFSARQKSRARVLRQLSGYVGGLGGLIDTSVTALKHVVRRR